MAPVHEAANDHAPKADESTADEVRDLLLLHLGVRRPVPRQQDQNDPQRDEQRPHHDLPAVPHVVGAFVIAVGSANRPPSGATGGTRAVARSGHILAGAPDDRPPPRQSRPPLRAGRLCGIEHHLLLPARNCHRASNNIGYASKMQANKAATVHPTGDGRPKIGNAVAPVLAGPLAGGMPLPAALPGPEAGRLCTLPAPNPVPSVFGRVVPNPLGVVVSGVVGSTLICDDSPEAATFAWARPKVMDVVAVYRPAGSPTLPSPGRGMVGSPGMNGTSIWCETVMTKPPASALAAGPVVVSWGSRTRMEMPSWARVASTDFCSCCGVIPTEDAESVVAMCTPVSSM